ncbi:MAG: lytic transglycosylase domain-containing protein [Pseudomonadota bacterium]
MRRGCWSWTAALGVVLLLAIAVQAQARTIPYRSCFERSADQHRIPVDLLIAVSAVESNWNANARSHANAHGLMQIQWPGTAKHLGVRRVSDLYKPCTNIELGARYLRELLDTFGNDEQMALAAYNYGPSRIAKEKTLPAGARRYAAKVQSKRGLAAGMAITRADQRAVKPAAAVARLAVLRVRSRPAAERYLRVLKRRVAGADFSYRRLPNGRHGIEMQPRDGGLSRSDRLVLETFGWKT